MTNARITNYRPADAPVTYGASLPVSVEITAVMTLDDFRKIDPIESITISQENA